MEIFHDYAFVISGKKRREVVKLLSYPRTPTELAKMLKVHANVITRIIKDLMNRNLVEGHKISGRRGMYRLTKRGELARQILDNLMEPKSVLDLVKLLKVHRGVVASVTKHLVRSGFVTLFKTVKPARKFYQLTRKGEAVKEKLDT
jgi:predicted transcriptional regulator